MYIYCIFILHNTSHSVTKYWWPGIMYSDDLYFSCCTFFFPLRCSYWFFSSLTSSVGAGSERGPCEDPGRGDWKSWSAVWEVLGWHLYCLLVHVLPRPSTGISTFGRDREERCSPSGHANIPMTTDTHWPGPCPARAHSWWRPWWRHEDPPPQREREGWCWL